MRMVLCTCPAGEAERIARALVEERLAACVNVVPGVRSFYWWEGKVADDAEVLLVMKTTDERVQALVDGVRRLHTYSVPEVIAFEVREGNPDYLAWVAREVRPG